MKRKSAVRLICLLLSVIFLLTAGCGDSGIKESDKNRDLSMGQDGAMGRYVEEETDLSEVTENISGMKRLSDGRLVITDCQAGLQVSDNQGTAWEGESREWLDGTLHDVYAYVMDVQVMDDGTVGVIYNGYNETEEGFDFSPECVLVKQDGTVIPVTLSLTEEEMYANRIWMSDTGRVFVTTLGDTIYEINEDGSSEAYLNVEGRPELLQFWQDLMLIDGYGYKAPLLYDMETEAYIEDKELEEFVDDQYADRGFNGGSWYDLYYFFDEDGILYLAGKKGLHRHRIGEDEMEQLIDGNLSCLGNPKYGIEGMVPLENEEFLAAFNSGKLVRFSFDPDVPSVPREKIKLYSLEESYALRVAISIYQVTHPDVYVEYETGIAEGSGITREDALKKLNTEIMAGEGPDLLMLDGLPMDSYIDKGLLLDLAGFMDDLSKKEELFENLFEAFEKKDGTHTGIYVVPGQVQFPVMLGREKYVSQMTDLSSIADGIEQIRRDNPGRDILRICSEKSIMKIFSVASEPSWKKENGEIDREAVAEFLVQIKRIYDAQVDSIDQKGMNRYEWDTDWYAETLGEDWIYDLSVYGLNTLDYVGGYAQFMVGMTSYPYGYFDITSAAKAAGFEDTLLLSMGGQSSGIFVPQTMLGINAASSQKELAEDFLGTFLGEEVQYALGGFSVNQTAFDRLFEANEEELGENNQYGLMGMMDEDGIETLMQVYYPKEEELALLKGWMGLADTPYIADRVFEETVFEEGAKFIQEDQSLEEALDAIWQQLAIYMSE